MTIRWTVELTGLAPNTDRIRLRNLIRIALEQATPAVAVYLTPEEGEMVEE